MRASVVTHHRSTSAARHHLPWLGLAVAWAAAACAYEVDEVHVEADEQALLAAGSLDSSFGNAGKVSTQVAVGAGGVYAALQGDGKIVVAVTLQDLNTGNTGLFGVLRYLPNGALDAGFGQAGVARTAWQDKTATVRGLALTADDKVIVIGEASFTEVTSTGQRSRIQFAVARYTSSGALDTGFGQGGKLTTSVLGNFDRATAAVVQPDGKLLVAGSALTSFTINAPTNTALVRYLSNGALDSAFGQAGIVSVPGVTGVESLALQADGSILVANGAATTPRVARFNAQGGSVPVAQSGRLGPISGAAFTRITFQPDSTLLVARAERGINRRTFLAKVQRYTLAGALDNTFNNPAFSYVPQISNTSSLVQAFASRADGSLVVAGVAPTAVGQQSFGVAALTANGALATGFGTNGSVTTQFTGSDQATAVLLQPDGKIVAVGESGTSTGYSLSLARYLGP